MKIHQTSASDFIGKVFIDPIWKRLTFLLVPTARLVQMNKLKHKKFMELRLSCATGKRSGL